MSDYRNELINSIQRGIMPIVCGDEARQIINVIIAELNNYTISEKCTDVCVVDEYNTSIMKRYVTCLRMEGKSEKTIEQYKNSCVNIWKFTNKNFDEITTYDIRFYISSLMQRGISNRTCENYRSYISAFYRWMTIEEFINKNPCDPIKHIKYADEIRYPFSDIDVDALKKSCCTNKQIAIVEMLLSSGVRCSELVNMNIDDIDFSNLTAHVRNGKGGKDRTIYITAVTKKYLLRYLEERNDTNPSLILGRGCSRITTGGVRDILRRVGHRANVNNVHPHRFRRTLATNLAARGMAIQEIQKILGHSNISTTMEYIYVNGDKVNSSYRRYVT